MTVFDWSAWRPSRLQVRAMVAAGVVGGVRYLTDIQPDQEWKRFTTQEDELYRSELFPIALNWEHRADGWRLGFPGGLAYGREARRQARILGRPDRQLIVCSSFDDNLFPGDGPTALEHMRGFVEGAGGPQPPYGQAWLIDLFVAEGLAPWGWQSASWAYHDNLRTSVHSRLRQRTTKSFPQFPPEYDENDILTGPDWGQYPSPQEAPMAAPYSLWRDTAGVVWRVAADAQSRVPVDGDALAVDTWFLTRDYGPAAAAIGASASNVQAWLNTIPDGRQAGAAVAANTAAIIAVKARLDAGLTVRMTAG